MFKRLIIVIILLFTAVHLAELKKAKAKAKKGRDKPSARKNKAPKELTSSSKKEQTKAIVKRKLTGSRQSNGFYKASDAEVLLPSLIASFLVMNFLTVKILGVKKVL